MLTLETLAPQTWIPAANHLAACKGLSLAELLTYRLPTHQDELGNRYAWCGVQVDDDWLGGMMQPLVRPEWDVDEQIDMVLAQQAFESLSLLQTLPEPGEPFSMPTGLILYIGIGLPQALGLTRLVE